MRRTLLLLTLVPALATATGYEKVAKRIIDEARGSDQGWTLLTELCDDIGHRLSGSKSLERAVEWAIARLKAAGHENVRGEPVMVPHWVRGRESAELMEPLHRPLVILGVGRSAGTPPEGITAEVLVAADEAAFEALGDRVKGRIVLFDNPMPEYDAEKGAGYGGTVRFRGGGARLVEAKGGVGALVRSVTARSLRTPHTGTQSYGEGIPKVPVAAVTTEDAAYIARLFARGKKVVVRLKMEAKHLPDAKSHNVVAELRGREKPEEVVVIGGHLDSWDVGQGAHDDGTGVVAAMEALGVLRRLKLQPRRTIRVVLWTNEENGLEGAKAYAKAHEKEVHVGGIESDSGGFAFVGFSVDHADEDARGRAVAKLQTLAPLFAPLGGQKMSAGFSGADLNPLKDRGIPLLGLRVDGSKYFDYHHTAADTLDKVVREEFVGDIAGMALMAYLLADLPDRIDAPANGTR